MLADAAGAAVVVNYRDDDAAEQIRAAAPDGVSRIVELALGPNLELDLADRGAVRGDRDLRRRRSRRPTVPVRALMTPNLLLRFVLVYTIPRGRAARGGRRRLPGLAVGALTTLPVHRFALADAAGAHDAVEGGAVGKVVIEMP